MPPERVSLACWTGLTLGHGVYDQRMFLSIFVKVRGAGWEWRGGGGWRGGWGGEKGANIFQAKCRLTLSHSCMDDHSC